MAFGVEYPRSAVSETTNSFNVTVSSSFFAPARGGVAEGAVWAERMAVRAESAANARASRPKASTVGLVGIVGGGVAYTRSEERRVGKECRWRGWREQ